MTNYGGKCGETMTAKPPVPSEAQYSQVCFLGDDKRDCFNKGFAVGYNARDVIAQQEAFTRQVNESAERVAQWPAHKIDGAEDMIARLEADLAEERERSCDRRDALNRMSARLLEAETRASKRNVAELEAEVAELRKRPTSARELAEKHGFKPHNESDERIVVELMTKRDATLQERPVPRRTPELTERVARLLYEQFGDSCYSLVHAPTMEKFVERASAVIDLVLGKEPSDG